ncbi:hypothetical protein ACFVQ4_28690 [Streptomyces laurentii]|uniref:hypothetical protein n=1 Tax=Streptomyces laurentii TaxID=39478 RepID=UPI00369475D6
MAGGLSACSPAPKNIVAVETVDGSTVRLLTMKCSEFTAEEFGVYRQEESDGELTKWAVTRALTGSRQDSIQIFKQPDGWKTYGSSLKEIQEGFAYVATVHGRIGTKPVSGSLRFEVPQLGSLAAGEVLASDTDGNTATMSRDDFLKDSAELCRELAS